MPGPESPSSDPVVPETPIVAPEPADLEVAKEEALDEVQAILDEVVEPPAAGKDYNKEVYDMLKDGSIVDLFEDFADILGDKITGASGIDPETWTAFAKGAGLGAYKNDKNADQGVADLSPKEKREIAKVKASIEGAPSSKGEILPKEKWLWPKASHFSFREGTETRVTSLPQAKRKINRNGVKLDRPHNGVDFSAAPGSELIMSQNAIVVDAGFDNGSGNYIKVQYEDGTSASFSHLSEIMAAEGQRVVPGQIFAKTGNTGTSTGPHLHLNAYDRGGKLADPFHFLRGAVSPPEGYAYFKEYDKSHEGVADAHEDHDHGDDEEEEAA